MSDPARALLLVKVVPRASRTALSRDAAGVLCAHLTAPPVDGQANRALIELLAKRFGLKHADIEIARGERGRRKLVCVHGCTREDLERRVDAALRFDVDKDRRRG